MANPISLMRNRFGARVKRITTLSAGIGRHPVGIVRWFHSELGAGGPLENLQHDANAKKLVRDVRLEFFFLLLQIPGRILK